MPQAMRECALDPALAEPLAPAFLGIAGGMRNKAG